MSNGKCRWVVLIPFLPLKTYVEHVIPHKSDNAGGMRIKLCFQLIESGTVIRNVTPAVQHDPVAAERG